MWKTILRRVLIMIPQIIILSILVFMLAKAMPGDPFTGSIGPNTDPKQIVALKRAAGLYDPWYQQYWHWIVNLFHGNLGESYTLKQPVTAVLGNRISNTIWLSLLTLIISYAVAIPLGMTAGRYEGSRRDRGIVIFNFITFGVPTFVVFLLGLFLFGYQLGWFPTTGTISADASGFIGEALSRLNHMILPAILAGILGTTSTIQYLRSEIIDSKSQDYVRTARAKGVPTNKVYSRHIFRNSLLPIAAFAGFQITGLIGGSIIVETVFSYPGMGQLFVSSITSRDYSVVTAIVLFTGILALLGSLLSDIIMSIVDPRIRIE
ncbi:oligopeptide ABC transporter permease [Periweissella beninensis]|uniref:ABC transporter permease n=1 Tax=Periweissella beninensis TaxID=504936 RepID=A0ABT0VMX1_9LACO|nr:oligopeptide ABC transporter permease [Periweissella beninensis]MBM7544438.1 peptide/nickel transport system permease protein [Periweissella beninensis]MCM2437875.1 ABC transporter permease [Periweissella beninensis]MCT4396733.1 ABC transporter permease [Periweissella beninensis]